MRIMVRRCSKAKYVEIVCGSMKVRIETACPLVCGALRRREARKVLTVAIASVAAALVEGGPWLREYVQAQFDFMQIMKNYVERDRFR